MKARRAFANELIVGLVSISDRASQGVYVDQGLPGLQQWFARALKTPLQTHQRLIADDRSTIEQTLIELVDDVGCDLVLTTGGTGPARRDVTPEATLAVATRVMPGFGEQMRTHLARVRADRDFVAPGRSAARDRRPCGADFEFAGPAEGDYRNTRGAEVTRR